MKSARRSGRIHLDRQRTLSGQRRFGAFVKQFRQCHGARPACLNGEYCSVLTSPRGFCSQCGPHKIGKLRHEKDAAAHAQTWIGPPAAGDLISKPAISIDNASPEVTVEFKPGASGESGFARNHPVSRQISHHLPRICAERTAGNALPICRDDGASRVQKMMEGFQVRAILLAEEEGYAGAANTPISHQKADPVSRRWRNFSKRRVIDRQLLGRMGHVKPILSRELVS